MKFRLRFLAYALGAGLAFAAPTPALAQVSVGVQIGAPAWGPPVQQGTQYYYIPEIDGYYDIYNGVYIVFDGVQWVTMPYIDGYDPYYFHPVPVSYVGAQPWLYINNYRRYYPQYVVGFRRGGWGNAGRGFNHEYGAGRVYGYDHGGAYGGRGFDHPGGGRPGGFYPGAGANQGGFNGGNRGNGQPQGNRGGFPGGGQPGGGNAGGFPNGGNRGGQPGGFGGGNAGGGQRGGFGGGNSGGGPGGGRHGR